MDWNPQTTRKRGRPKRREASRGTKERSRWPGAKLKQLLKIGRNGKQWWTPYVPLGTERSENGFVVRDEDVNAFSEQQKNENTKTKTLYGLKIFREFLESCDEKRKMEDITLVELQAVIKNFVLAVRKKNSDKCEPSSVRAFFFKVSTVNTCITLL